MSDSLDQSLDNRLDKRPNRPALHGKAWLLWWLLRIAGSLPLRWLHGLGAGLGGLAVFLGTRESSMAWKNIQACLPELDPKAQRQLHRECLIETGKSLLELPHLWTKSPVQLMRLIVQVEGQTLLSKALSAGNGVIIAAPHLGAWEILNLWLADQTPIQILYRAPRLVWLEDLLNQVRGRSRAEPVRAEPQAVRRLLKSLQKGGVLGILPDQKPKLGEGELAQFFGKQALTMTLLPKLALRTGATVLFAFARRLPTGQGFQIVVREAAPAVDDTLSLNANLESCARQVLAQYQWTYKRFPYVPPEPTPDPRNHSAA